MGYLRRYTLIVSSVAIFATAGLWPGYAQAAEWPAAAFEAATAQQALKALYGTTEVAPSDAILLKVQSYTQNGALVPIVVSTTLPNVQSIAILVDKNPAPLIAALEPVNVRGYLAVHIKMAQSSDVRVVVKSGDKLYGKSQPITVTVGGCGGEIDPPAPSKDRTMKLRTVAHGGSGVELRMLITHPMESGQRTDKNTKQKIPPHFVQRVVLEHKGKPIATTLMAGGVAENPLLGFHLKDAKNGDPVKISWNDSRGESGALEGRVSL